MIKITRNFFCTSLFFLASCFLVHAEIPAFPGAEGGGMYTTGGRGGTVYYVTSLDDTNTGNTTTREGTLRWCVGRSGARIILFKVSGIISIASRLNISSGNVTIAGQTAPGDGICIRDHEVTVSADNVIIRYMRFRLGDRDSTQESDAIWGRYRNNIIIDHCSMSWSVDECSSFYSNSNFTMQWCLLAESLKNSIHDKGAHGYCGLWGGKNATFHHNLMAHHDSRNPRYSGWKRTGLDYFNPMDEERMDFRNNVVYNWGSNSGYGGESAGKYNVVNNYYKPGPATSNGSKSRLVQIDIDAGTQIFLPRYGKFYLYGNYMYGNSSVISNNRNGVYNKTGFPLDSCLVSVPYASYPISQHTAEKAFEKVLEYAGASLKRDTIDARIAKEALNGTYTYTGSKYGTKGIIDTQSDVGGWPTYNSTTPPTDSNIDGIPDGWLEANYPGKTATNTNAEGYTYLEVYLNSLVADITENQNMETIISSINRPEALVAEPRAFYEKSVSAIQLFAPEAIDKVTLISIDGRLQKTVQANRSTTYIIDASNLNDGVYLIHVKYLDGSTGKSKVLIHN